jgi:polyribonucleotide nucleotidyltransferase
VVAGTAHGVLMVESEAKSLSEEVMLGAVVFGHEQMQVAIKAINELVAQPASRAGTGRRPPRMPSSSVLREGAGRRPAVRGLSHHREAGATPRSNEIKAALTAAVPQADGKPKWAAQDIDTQVHNLESSIVRNRILNGEPRIDGRDYKTVRPINIKVGVAAAHARLGAVHARRDAGAGRVTLGTSRDAQIIDALEGERREPFMLHYNFPPFSVGETGMMGSPKRREIGHGNLARRGIAA